MEVFSPGSTWQPAHINQSLHPRDHLRTGANSRLALRWSDQSIVPLSAASELEILPASTAQEQAGLHLLRGVLSFFHRDEPGRIRIITRGAVAGVEGTEFVLAVDEADRTTLSVIDGKVKFSNPLGALALTNGQQAVAAPGTAPAATASFTAANLLQWCAYYPAVLHPADLPLTAAEQEIFRESLTAYETGDLLAALAKFPATPPTTDAARLYHAALLLAVGQVPPAEDELNQLTARDPASRPQKIAAALRELIAAAKNQPRLLNADAQLATEFLARSYGEQSRAVPETSLRQALASARAAAAAAPQSGFAWARVAELEFCFGRTAAALTALDESLKLTPRHAQALALKGFILLARNQPQAAQDWFEQALAADAALGNAWLGRGLCRLHRGETAAGRADLMAAAALEPQRAELRSYLAKAHRASGDAPRAATELVLAQKLDPNDPTAWLYSALLKQQRNEVNDAIRDLEKSKELNGNRSVYRSQFLLDQDQAVRSANLATMYRDAGMTDVSVREAATAVSRDYANYSAHLFLGGSYNQWRDANEFNVRYEAPAVAEFWLANLLAPAGAGWLSPLRAEQPTTRWFPQNRFGLISETTYLSRGFWREEAEQSFTSRDFSYNFGVSYVQEPGQRADHDFEARSFELSLKAQLTPDDSLFFSVQRVRQVSGAVSQYYDPAQASPDFRFSETQLPNFFLGYHHEWSPGVHTLFFATSTDGHVTGHTTNAVQNFGWIYGGQYTAVGSLINNLDAKINLAGYSTELQQVFQTPKHTTVLGARYQWGRQHYHNEESISIMTDGYETDLFPNPSAYPIQDFSLSYHALGIYGYHSWQIAEPFAVTAGLAYDWVHLPANVAAAPFSPVERTVAQLSPKLGFIWTPAENTTVRAAYTRSLSGFINGQSLRLEPTEVAGLNQSFRSLIPESVGGDTSGSRFDVFGLSLEQKFSTGTYLALAGQLLWNETDHYEGGYVYNSDEGDHIPYPTYTTGLRRKKEFQECSLRFNVNQLLGKEWAVGAGYRLTQANLKMNYTDLNTPAMVNNAAGLALYQDLTSLLHTVNLHANWNHPSGLFAVFAADWNHQQNSGFTAPEPGDDFWQCNAYLGYRFWHRRAEATVGLLNIFDQNYRLEPLNLYNETARSRTFFARLRISF